MYDHQQIDHTIVGAADVGSAADPIATALAYVGSQPQMVRGIWATQTVAQTTAPAVLTFKYRPTPGSATNQVTIGTLTIPTGTAAGKQVYKDVTPYLAMPGGQIVVQTDGGGEGNATLGYRHTPKWEHPSNNTNAIASA
jgi:hypothetical protein